jgi:hypothetical protein
VRTHSSVCFGWETDLRDLRTPHPINEYKVARYRRCP